MDKILLNDIQGSRWIFDCDEKNRLFYSKNGLPKQILQSDITEEFDLITDEHGNFHLVTQSKDGSLIYFTYDFSNWKKYVILKSKSNNSSMRKFKLFASDGVLHCFYILELKGKAMLVHHIFSHTDQFGSPDVISYIDSSKSFSCAADNDGNIHIFFFDESGNLRYKVYANGITDDRTLSVEDHIKSIFTISDGNIHIIYTAKMKSYCTLIYYNLTEKERKIISFSDSNIADIHIFIRDKNIFIQWRERTRCYQCISSDGGCSFKKPTHISETHNKRLETVRLRAEHNPYSFYADCCIIEDSGIPATNKPGNHTFSKKDYNIIDGSYSDELKIIQSKIRENEKEIVRLNTIINTMSERLGALTKSLEVPPPTPEKELLSGSNVGEISEENYKRFKNMEIENIENPKTFE